MEKKPKLLVLLSRVPYPLDKGDKLRAFHQLKSLNEHYTVILCCLSTKSHLPEFTQKKLREISAEYHIFKLSKWGILKRLAFNLFKDLPFQVAYFHSNSIQKELDLLIEKHLPKRFYCQLIRVTEYAKKYTIFSKTLDYMDALSIGMERRVKKAPFYLKPFVVSEAKRLQKYEKQVFKEFEKKIIISQADQQHIQHSNTAHLEVIPNGIDTEYFHALGNSKKVDILFTGNMGYPPNIESAQYLVKKVLPLLPDTTTINICGKSPHMKVRLLASKQVNVTGWVDDIRIAYDEARIFVAPLWIGSGLQNKLLEAMAMGIPCITTPLANKALGAEPEKEILIASNETEFQQQILRLLHDDQLKQTIATHALDYVTKNYNWKACNQKLIHQIER